MKKMNYSNFDDSVEVIPVSSVEIVDVKQNKSFSTVSGQASATIANTINPVVAITSVVNTVLSTISDITKCIAMVSIERQKTKQIEAQVRVQREEAIQRTNTIRIQEKENTKRFILQCKTDLEKKEQELKIIRENNRLKEYELKQDHKLYMEQLDNLNKIVENIMNDKNIICRLILERGDEGQGLETLLHFFNNINTKLVEISKEIVELKKG